MSVHEAAVAIDRLKPGECFVYFRGHLARDRERYDGTANTPVVLLGDFMQLQGTPGNFSFGDGCSVDGASIGTLAQRRIGHGHYEYLFIKLSS